MFHLKKREQQKQKFLLCVHGTASSSLTADRILRHGAETGSVSRSVTLTQCHDCEGAEMRMTPSEISQ
jgi:hypothetical protein